MNDVLGGGSVSAFHEKSVTKMSEEHFIDLDWIACFVYPLGPIVSLSRHPLLCFGVYKVAYTKLQQLLSFYFSSSG